MWVNCKPEAVQHSIPAVVTPRPTVHLTLHFPSLMNDTPRHSNYFPWGSSSSTPRGSDPLFSFKEPQPQTWTYGLLQLLLAWLQTTPLSPAGWWSQQSHVVCMKKRRGSEPPQPDTLLPLPAPWCPGQEHVIVNTNANIQSLNECKFLCWSDNFLGDTKCRTLLCCHTSLYLCL